MNLKVNVLNPTEILDRTYTLHPGLQPITKWGITVFVKYVRIELLVSVLKMFCNT